MSREQSAAKLRMVETTQFYDRSRDNGGLSVDLERTKIGEETFTVPALRALPRLIERLTSITRAARACADEVHMELRALS